MVLEVRVRYRHRGCYSESLPVGARVVHVTGDGAHCHSSVSALTEKDLDATLALLAPFLDATEVVERAGATALVRCTCPVTGLATRLRDTGSAIVWPTHQERGLERWTFLAPSRAHVARLRAALAREGDVLSLRATDVPAAAVGAALPLADVARALTPRQLAALTRAIRRGYYATPRRASGDDLAREAGLSRSTFLEHLRKAEARVLADLGDSLAAHPALAAMAAKRAGRPRRARRGAGGGS